MEQLARLDGAALEKLNERALALRQDEIRGGTAETEARLRVFQQVVEATRQNLAVLTQASGGRAAGGRAWVR